MTETKKVGSGPLTGTLWLGTAGAVLIMGGLVALLAANWHSVPLAAQVLLAFAPLMASWVGYGWYLRRGARSLGLEEVLGTVWTGGVLCSIALLGRVLQLASDSFAFCATMAALLLPVMYAVRSTVAWMACGGFFLATAILTKDLVPNPSDSAGWIFLVVAVGVLAIAPRLAWAWRSGGFYALGQRWLGAVGAVASAWFLGIVSWAWWDQHLQDHAELAIGLAVVAWPLFAGAFAERSCSPRGRALSLLGLCNLCWWFVVLLLSLSDRWLLTGGRVPGWAVVACAVVVGACQRWVWRGEGLFLWLLPIFALAHHLQTQLVGMGLAMGVGAVAMGVGVCIGKRSLANEGLLFLLAMACLFFIQRLSGLMTQGALLVLGGLALVALNVALARLAKKGGRHA